MSYPSLFYQSGVLLFEQKEPFVGIRWDNMNRRATEGHKHIKEEQEKLAATREIRVRIFERESFFI